MCRTKYAERAKSGLAWVGAMDQSSGTLNLLRIDVCFLVAGVWGTKPVRLGTDQLMQNGYYL